MGNDHHIAQFHLEFFAEDPRHPFLCRYDKEGGYTGMRPISRLASEQDLYPADVDEWMKRIETLAAIGMQDLVEGAQLGRSDRKDQLLDYLAMTAVRHPAQMQDWETSLQHSEYTGRWLELVTREAKGATIRDDFFPFVRDLLRPLEWNIVRYEGGPPLILGDNPVVYNFRNAQGEMDIFTFVLMPISPTLLLYGFWDDELVGQLSEQIHVNAMSFDRASRYILSGARIDQYFEEIRDSATWLRELQDAFKRGEPLPDD
jgi:hypothetical protein